MTRDSDGRRMAETGTGSGRSPTSAVPLAAIALFDRLIADQSKRHSWLFEAARQIQSQEAAGQSNKRGGIVK